jgi:TPR repeat protein
VENDPAEAARLYEQSAKLGYFSALGNLGVHYINGAGVKKDDQKAVELFRTGSDAGDAYCMFLLARCFEGGVGMAKNSAEARKMYERAAKAGNPQAIAWCQKNSVPLDTTEPDR